MFIKSLIRNVVYSNGSKIRPLIRPLPLDADNGDKSVIKMEVVEMNSRQINWNNVVDSFNSTKHDAIKNVAIREEDKSVLIDIDANAFVKSCLKYFKSDDDIKLITNNLINESKQTIVVEYSSPNIAKSFHVGHLRSTIIGNFVSNINEYLGHDVIRLNYLGDWGTQYGLLSLGYELFGNENELINNPISHLNEVYVKINETVEKDEKLRFEAKERFKLLESRKDEKLLKQWKQFRQLSLNEFDKTYLRLGIKFNHTHGESMYTIRECQDVIKWLNDRKLTEKDASGAIYYKMKDKKTGLNQPVPLIKSDGTSLYLTRDIAAAIHREKLFNFHQMLYVVEANQSKHFKHLKHILKSLDSDWVNDLTQVQFGRIMGMSSRKGTVVLLDDLLNEAKMRSLEAARLSGTTKVSIDEYDDVADIIGMSSIIVNDMKFNMKRNYNFDWREVLQREGDTGTALQYLHSSLVNLIEQNHELEKLIKKNNYNLNDNQVALIFNNNDAINMLIGLSSFDDYLLEAYYTRDPNSLIKFLFLIKKLIGKCKKSLNVKNEGNQEVAITWLTLFMVSRNVLNRTMRMIGLNPVDKM